MTIDMPEVNIIEWTMISKYSGANANEMRRKIDADEDDTVTSEEVKSLQKSVSEGSDASPGMDFTIDGHPASETTMDLKFKGAVGDVYSGEPFDVTAMRAMRERQIRHLVTGGTFNAKYSPGGLVDVEYLVQGLQITHGYRDHSLRQTNIRKAMAALAAAGVLPAGDYTRLRKAHTFLQWLIDALRMVRGNAKDLTVPPADSEAFAFLARRLRYGNDAAQLREDLARYTACVQEQSARLLV